MIEFAQKFSLALARRTYFLHKCNFKHLGKRSVIYKPVMVRGRKYISMGDYCTVFANGRIEIIDKHLNQTFKPSLEIGNNTSFEQNVHITCAKHIKIGNNCSILANVCITDIDHTFLPNTHPLMNDFAIDEVIIGDNVFVGMGSLIFKGTKLGNNVVVGANSVVKDEFPDNVMIAGSPAKIIKRFDEKENKWIK